MSMGDFHWMALLFFFCQGNAWAMDMCACACGFDALIEFNAAQFGPGPTLLLTRRAKDEPQWPSVSQAEMGDYVTGIAIGMPRRMSQEMLVDGRW